VALHGSVREVDLADGSSFAGKKTKKNKLTTFYVLNDLRCIERSCDIFRTVYTLICERVVNGISGYAAHVFAAALMVGSANNNHSPSLGRNPDFMCKMLSRVTFVNRNV